MQEIIMAKKTQEVDVDIEFELLSKYMTYYVDYLVRKCKSKNPNRLKHDTFEMWKLKKQKQKSKSKKNKKVIKINPN